MPSEHQHQQQQQQQHRQEEGPVRMPRSARVNSRQQGWRWLHKLPVGLDQVVERACVYVCVCVCVRACIFACAHMYVCSFVRMYLM